MMHVVWFLSLLVFIFVMLAAMLFIANWCINKDEYWWSWPLYMALEIPLTVITFIGIIFFGGGAIFGRL